MSDQIDELETFDEVEEVTAAAEPVAPKAGKVKKEKASKPARVSKPVTLQAISPETLLFPPDEFVVTLNSVSGRAYEFQEPTTMLSWITRRIYNGEAVSDQVKLLHKMLATVRFMTTLDRRLQEIGEHYNAEADYTKTLTWNAFRRLGAKAQEALVNVDNEVSALSGYIQEVTSILNSIEPMLEIPTEDTKTVESEATSITAEDGTVTNVPAVVRTSSTANARKEAAAELADRIAKIRNTRILLAEHISPDA